MTNLIKNFKMRKEVMEKELEALDEQAQKVMSEFTDAVYEIAMKSTDKELSEFIACKDEEICETDRLAILMMKSLRHVKDDLSKLASENEEEFNEDEFGEDFENDFRENESKDNEEMVNHKTICVDKKQTIESFIEEIKKAMEDK